MHDVIIKKVAFDNGEVDVIFRPIKRPQQDAEIQEGLHEAMSLFGHCPPFDPRTYRAADGIICEQDVAVKMRDGVILYADIYRPEGQTNIPCLVTWSPFGKRLGSAAAEWQLMGVPPGTVSNLAAFEACDPAYWCHCGYAVALVDIRGIGHSEGDLIMFGRQDGRDGYDFIEWVATQLWCNGKVGMSGNSALAMAQWRIAAEQPPHLACIAPWEGTTDIFRETAYVGGILDTWFLPWIAEVLTGLGYVEDGQAMALKYPFMNAYWQDKIPKWERITVPTYMTLSWNHMHLRGSAEAWRRIRSRKKWLRTHREFEWPDTYANVNLEDLRRFFDRYCKDIRNGWEFTPRVRLEVEDAYDFDYQTNRPEKEFPIARTQYKKLYLDGANGRLSFDPIAKNSNTSYEGETGSAAFNITFEEDTEISGYMKLHLWVEADGNDDMALFINIRKLDEEGNFVPILVLGETDPGTVGRMRVSRRELDEKLSSDFQPVQAHLKEEKLKPGEIVPVDIEIYPTSRFWHKGEQLEVVVSGHFYRENWFQPFAYETNNKGKHIIHSGGKYDSYLQIPVIPPRYRRGDYILR
jgi:uncharacterized protein